MKDLDMLVAIDIGNTNVAVGIFEHDQLTAEFKLHSDLRTTVDEYGALLLSLIERKIGGTSSLSRAIISSVVPPLTATFCSIIHDVLQCPYIVVGPGIKTGVSIHTEDPRGVGSDRIVNAVAVKALYGAPALAIDFGTATTIDYISASGAYEGGVIAPGISLSVEALVERTAQLPKIELLWPSEVVGRNTISAMQSGVLVGYVCMVDGLIERIQEEKGEIPHVVATGGFAELMAKYSSRIKLINNQLNLIGLRLISERNINEY